MGSALVSLLGTDDLADFFLLPSAPNGRLGRKHSRGGPNSRTWSLTAAAHRTPPSTEVQEGTETFMVLPFLSFTKFFHGPLPSRNGSNKGSCGTLRYHHNQWRNQASYFYILASLILRAWMQCSWVRMRTWRVTSLPWTWHTQSKLLFQAMCGRDCPGASWNTHAHQVHMLDDVPPCGRPRQSPVWTQGTWASTRMTSPDLSRYPLWMMQCLSTAIIQHLQLNSESLPLGVGAHSPQPPEIDTKDGRVGHSNPPTY